MTNKKAYLWQEWALSVAVSVVFALGGYIMGNVQAADELRTEIRATRQQVQATRETLIRVESRVRSMEGNLEDLREYFGISRRGNE